MELLHILETAVNAVFPVVLMMLLGYVLQRIGFFSPEFIRGGSKFSFRVLMPSMLFVNVYNESLSASMQNNLPLNMDAHQYATVSPLSSTALYTSVSISSCNLSVHKSCGKLARCKYLPTIFPEMFITTLLVSSSNFSICSAVTNITV